MDHILRYDAFDEWWALPIGHVKRRGASHVATAEVPPRLFSPLVTWKTAVMFNLHNNTVPTFTALWDELIYFEKIYTVEQPTIQINKNL